MKKNYHHGDLKLALIEAGLELIKEKNDFNISLREVAKKVGVSHNAPYRHFKGKAELISEIAQNGFYKLSSALEKTIQKYPDDPSKQLIEAGVEYVILAKDNPQIIKLMFGGIINDCKNILPSSDKNSFSGLVDIIKFGQKEGAFKDYDLDILTLNTWSLVHGISMLVIAGQFGNFTSNNRLKKLVREILMINHQGVLK